MKCMRNNERRKEKVSEKTRVKLINQGFSKFTRKGIHKPRKIWHIDLYTKILYNYVIEFNNEY